MKNSIFFIVSLLFIGACNNEPKQNKSTDVKVTAPETKTEVKTDTLHAAVYSCPMHPEVKGKKGDKCPKCGMALTTH